MIRVIAAVWVSSTLALTGLVGAGAASAEPWPPSPCGFSITPPEVVQVDGVTGAVFAFDIAGEHISRIWAVRNPEKLRSWTAG